MTTQIQTSHPPLSRWALWEAWVGANTVGELIGRAIPALVAGMLGHALNLASVATTTLSTAAIVLAGAMQGVVVGVVQWLVLRRAFPTIRATPWVVCTALGATLIWILGMIPNFLLGPVEHSMVEGLGRMNPVWQYSAAASVGFVLGVVLGLSQWLVLRHHVRNSLWWVPANAAAWTFGLPMVMVAAGSIVPGTPGWHLVGLAGVTLALTGAIVGAVHGAVLVWLTQQPDAKIINASENAEDATPLSPGATRQVFEHLPLRAHTLLAGVPLHSLDRLSLPGGRPDMTLSEISLAIGFSGEAEMEVGALTRGLFWLRGWIGRILGWDRYTPQFAAESFIHRLSEEERDRSLIKPGSEAGISRILYQFHHEMLGEIINRTVHCFWLMAVEATGRGYVVWFAIYVKKRNWFTPVYMALISPVLKSVIYPAMFRGARKRWAQNTADSQRSGTTAMAEESGTVMTDPPGVESSVEH